MSHSSSIESFPTHVLSIDTMPDNRNGDKNAVVKQVRCDGFYKLRRTQSERERTSGRERKDKV